MSDLALAIKLTTEGGQIVVKDLHQIDAAADKVNHSLTGTGKSGSVAGEGLNKASGGADVLTGSLKSMLAQAAGVIALGVGIDSIASGMYDGIDAFQGYRGQLKTITGDFDSASVELDRLINISKETPFTLAQSVEGFSKLTHLGLDPAKQSMISYGNTAAAMGKDLMQMIEAVADASVGEFERLKEFGIKASSQGDNVRFTFQNVSTTIKKDAASIQQYLIDLGNNKFGDAMADQMGRLSAKSSNLQTSIAQLYNEMGNLGASDTIGSSIDSIASLIDEITQNLPEILDDITSLFEVMAVVIGAKLLPAYTSLVANGIKTYIASNIAATASTNAMGQVISRTTVKMNLMAAAGHAAKSSLALIGGPAGAAILASYALYEFHGAMNETTTGAEQLEEALGKTTKAIEDMTRAEQLSTQAAYKKLINEKKAAIEELKTLIQEQAKLANNANGKNSSTAIGIQSWGTSGEADKATKELDALKNALSDVEGALFDAGMAGIKWNKVIVDGVDLAKEKAEADKKLASGKAAELTTNQKLIVALGQQVHSLGLTAKQKLINANLSKLSKDATLGEIATMNALSEAQYKQLQVNAQKQDDSDYYQSVIDGANDISESWNTAGNVIVNAFGTIGEQLDKLAQQQESYANKQKKIAADTLIYADDPKKLGEIAKAENALAKQKDRNAMSEISSYRSITDSAANMFSENSKGRKAMQAASDIFTAIELGNSALRIGSYALEAVTAAFAAPWPIGLPSGLAMIAIMAGLGVSVSGGGGGDSGNGTGTASTVKGGGKSESLSKANESLENIMIDQLAELRGLRGDLTNVQNLSYGLLSDLLNVDVGHHEIKNATERELESSIRGLNTGTASGTFTDELRGVFTGIDDAIEESVDILGLKTAKAVDNFIYKVGTISFDGLDAKAAGERLDQVLSAQSDLKVESIAPFVTQHQQIGEGALETLVRVAKEQTIFNDNIDKFGLSIANISNLLQIEVAQSIIKLTGGLDEFSELSDSYIDNFFSDAERFEFLEKSLTETFDSIGLSIVSSKKEFRALIEGLDLTTESGQALFASLLEINPALAEYVDELEKTIEKEKELANARKEFNSNLTEQIAQMDFSPLEKSLHNLNAQYTDDLAKALELGADVQLLEVFYGKQRVSIIEQQLTNANTTFDKAITGIASTLDKLIDSIANTRTGIAASIRNIKKQMGGFDEVGFLNNNIDGLYGQIGSGSIDEQISAVESLNDTIMQRYNVEREQFNELNSLRDERYTDELAQYDSLKSALKDLGSYAKSLSLGSHSPLSAGQRLNVASNNYYSDYSAAQDLDLDAINSISASADAYLNEARQMFGSASQFNAIFASVQSGLNQIASISVDVPEAPTAVEIYQDSALELQTSTITELNSLNLLLTTLENQAHIDANEQTQVATEQYHVQVQLIEKTNELSKAQLDEQKAMNDELRTANANQSKVINLLQQQVNELKEGNRNQSETNGHLSNKARQS